jgi:hypothetical protein
MLCAAPVNQMLNLLSDLSFSLYLSFPFFEAIYNVLGTGALGVG